MNTLRRQVLLQAFKLSDLLIMGFSFAVATAAAYSQIDTISFAQFLAMRAKIQNFVLFLGLLLVWHIVFSLFSLYNSRRLSNSGGEVIDVIKATSLGTLVLFLAAIIFRIEMATPFFFVVFWTGSSAITILNRLILRYLLHQIRVRGRNLRHMLIIGANSRAVRFAKKIEERPELGYHLIGFMDQDWRGIEEFQKAGYERIADFNQFPDFIKNNVVDEVAVFLPIKTFYGPISQIIAKCEEQGIIVRFLSDIFGAKLARSKTEQFEGESMITISRDGMHGWEIMIKSMFDFSFSLISITLLSPIFLVSALLIKFTSPGPVFFVQERMGLNKRKFRVYKFRTMVSDAEKKQSMLEHLNEISGPVFKIKNDPRITPIGKFLRKTSIDELPQLINVLKGEMSLVGPRPLPIRDCQGFDQNWHRRRFSVRPGITCLWQVNGRSNISFEKWMELDMEYIDQWSLGLDLKIIAKTIPAVMKGSGAA